MENLQNMSLSGQDSGMTPINNTPNEPQKNVAQIQQQPIMDSTPLNDVMPMNDSPGMPDAPFDSRSVPQVPAQMYPASREMVQVDTSPKNPMNLTDEQMQALIAGAVASVVFWRPIQEKLGGTIPQFLTENGTRSTTGLLASGLVAAVVFYFARRIIMDRN